MFNHNSPIRFTCPTNLIVFAYVNYNVRLLDETVSITIVERVNESAERGAHVMLYFISPSILVRVQAQAAGWKTYLPVGVTCGRLFLELYNSSYLITIPLIYYLFYIAAKRNKTIFSTSPVQQSLSLKEDVFLFKICDEGDETILFILNPLTVTVPVLNQRCIWKCASYSVKNTKFITLN